MRATRAYIAGFGTAGSVLAGCAILFIVASAVVAFNGWPQIATQGAPASLRLDATAPARGSRVDRRLAPLVLASATRPATAGAPARPGAGLPRARRVPGAQRRRGSAGLDPAQGATGTSRPGAVGATSSSIPTRPAPGDGNSGVIVGVGGVSVKAGGSDGVTVSAPATGVTPPVSVTVAPPPPRTGPPTAPTTPVGTVVRKVTDTPGRAVGSLGSTVGTLLGG